MIDKGKIEHSFITKQRIDIQFGQYRSAKFWDISVGIVMGCELDYRGSIPGRGKGVYSTPKRPDRLLGPHSLLYNGSRGRYPRR
jgi:hypothetical protein